MSPKDNLPAGYRTTFECWQKYPKLSFPDNIGARANAQKRAREACVAASMRGQSDPELAVGPAILRDPEALWAISKPWTKRPADKAGRAFNIVGRMIDPGGFLAGGFQTGGDRLRTMSTGWRPPKMLGEDRFQEVEQVSTALGGLDALIYAGVQPWVQLEGRVSRLLTLQLRGNAVVVELPLLGIIRDGARALGDPLPRDIDEAVEYIRAIVIEADLAGAAWFARANRILMTARIAQQKRKTVEQSISSATSVAATATAWLPPVGAGLTAVSLSASAASARTGMEKDRAEKLMETNSLAFQHQMELRGIRGQTGLYAQQLAQLQAEEIALIPAALLEGEKRAQLIQAGIWVGAVSITTATAYLLASALTRRTS